MAACATCIFLAALSWEFQEYNADVYSPRRLISGQVVLLGQNPHRGGSFDADLQVELADGHLTPIFTTGTLANDISKQPIHKDDALRILYRTRDNEPLAIDELSGANPGWKYRRPSQADWTLSIYSSIIALFSMAWLLKEYLRSRHGDELAYPDDTGNTQPSEVQTIGL